MYLLCAHRDSTPLNSLPSAHHDEIPRHAALHCQGYVALLGSDDQSWGWNLVDNQLIHNGTPVSPYPRINNPPKYQTDESDLFFTVS
ncbi:unnamed protein product [Gongylonema pulchrum]|uniref:RCC1/BLIP-II n=1 Tax=Gongylonema pulchrum TaxID=637853 RepID=A0A183EBI5_9BILA|nr:unnamed protein product [Gongylonema pulchrum]